MTLQATIPFKKALIFIEDGRDQYDRYVAAGYAGKIKIPELILYKYAQCRPDSIQQLPGVLITIHRQVKDMIRALVVLPYLVARWRKKCYDNCILWV